MSNGEWRENGGRMEGKGMMTERVRVGESEKRGEVSKSVQCSAGK